MADRAYHLATGWIEQGCDLGEAVAASAATVTGCHWALVVRTLPNKKARVVALFDGSQFKDTFDFERLDTASDSVLNSELYQHFANVQDEFPEDLELEQMGIIDYAGKSVRDLDNKVLGHLVLMHTHSMDDLEVIESVINRLVAFLRIEWANFYDKTPIK